MDPCCRRTLLYSVVAPAPVRPQISSSGSDFGLDRAPRRDEVCVHTRILRSCDLWPSHILATGLSGPRSRGCGRAAATAGQAASDALLEALDSFHSDDHGRGSPSLERPCALSGITCVLFFWLAGRGRFCQRIFLCLLGRCDDVACKVVDDTTAGVGAAALYRKALLQPLPVARPLLFGLRAIHEHYKPCATRSIGTASEIHRSVRRFAAELLPHRKAHDASRTPAGSAGNTRSPRAYRRAIRECRSALAKPKSQADSPGRETTRQIIKPSLI